MEVSTRAGVTQLVECDLAKVDVAGSNPVSRSILWSTVQFKYRISPAVLLAASSLLAQDYKLEPATGAPTLPPAYASMIQTSGYRVVGPAGPWCEIWWRKSLATAGKPKDDAIVLPLAQGTLLAVLRFPVQGYDRRGQPVKPAAYTLRSSNYPVDGAHQGVAPQRDFPLLTPLSADADPNAMPSYQALVDASVKGVGTPHPAVLSLEAPSNSTFPALRKEGDGDWVLSVKVGEFPIGILLIGNAEG